MRILVRSVVLMLAMLGSTADGSVEQSAVNEPESEPPATIPPTEDTRWNACGEPPFPSKEDWAQYHLKRFPAKQSVTVEEFARQDLADVSRQCSGIEFQPSDPILANDGTKALIYKAKADSKFAPLAAAYFATGSEIIRLGFRCGGATYEAHFRQDFARLIEQFAKKAQEKH